MYKYVIQSEEDKICSYLIDQDSDRTVEIHRDPVCEKAEEQAGYRIGQIFIGRVEQVHRNLAAAFVRIYPGQAACYLPLDQAAHPIYTKKGGSPQIQQGDELVVQITREPMKTKAAALTANLMLKGRCLLLNTGLASPSVSQKIVGGRREELRVLAQKLAREDCGNVLIRTNAAQLSDEEITAEAAFLRDKLEHIREIAMHRPVGTCLYDIPPAYLERIRDLDREVLLKVVTDDSDLYQQIVEYAEHDCPDIINKLVLYRDEMLAMDKLYSLDRRKELAASRTVLLKSGASLIIEPTEALTVIDVNSARTSAFHKKEDKEDMVLKVNLEAAEEIARQMRLRNMSGIIIADFINMERNESKKVLMNALAGFLAKDPVKAVVADMTKLNLVEMTRRKAEKPLWET